MATTKLAARRFQVPFPWRDGRLVEVVDVEGKAPLGRGEPAEVKAVAVACGLHHDATRRRGREIGRHYRGSTPQERKRCRLHAGIAQRQEVGQPRFRLFDQDLDRVAPVGGWLPVSMMLAGRSVAQRPATLDTLLDEQGVGLRRKRRGRWFNHWCLRR